MTFSAIVAPQILYPKQRLYSLVGVNYSLLCEVVANPAAKIVWSRGYGNMPANRFTSVNESLRISPFLTKDEGFYICIAENYRGIFLLVRLFVFFLLLLLFFVFFLKNPCLLVCSFVIYGTSLSLFLSKWQCNFGMCTLHQSLHFQWNIGEEGEGKKGSKFTRMDVHYLIKTAQKNLLQ